MATERLAVYGTLRRGQGNHELLIGSRFIGYGIIEDWMFCMYLLTIAPRKYGFTIVEVYEVDKDLLEGPIDALEGYPVVYNRGIFDVKIISDDYEEFMRMIKSGDIPDETSKAWAYYVPNTKCNIFRPSYLPSENAELGYIGGD